MVAMPLAMPEEQRVESLRLGARAEPGSLCQFFTDADTSYIRLTTDGPSCLFILLTDFHF